MPTTKKPDTELKLLGKLLEQAEITKIETRKLNDKIEGVRIWTRLELERFSDKILDEMALLRNDVANMKLPRPYGLGSFSPYFGRERNPSEDRFSLAKGDKRRNYNRT